MNKTKDGGLTGKILVCLAGAYIYALGICVTTRAALGISPISSVPYLASTLSGLTLGTCTLLMNGLFILVQRAVFGGMFPFRVMGMQMAITLVFSALIDVNMRLFGWYAPFSYAGRAVYLLFGCVVLAAGLTALVAANFVVLPGEGMVQCLNKYIPCHFGTAKVIFDCAMVATTIAVSWATLGRIEGVREGTVVCALLIGTISKVFMRRLCRRTSREGAAGNSAPQAVDGFVET